MYNKFKNKVMKKYNRRGISLISLLIIIIIIIIIVSSIISSITGKNILEIAKDAIFKHDLSEYNSEFNLWSSNEMVKTVGNFDASDVIATSDYGNYNGKTIKDILTNVKNDDLDKIEIIDGKVEQMQPIYTDKQLDDMIKNQGYIPIASSDELNNIRYNTENTFGKDTKWEKKYIGGVDKKYIQVKEVIMTNYSQGAGWVPIEQNNGEGNDITYFSGVYDGNGYGIMGMHIDGTNTDKVDIGLFSQASLNTAEFRNIYIQGFDITTGDKCEYAGSLLGHVIGSIKTIDNIHVMGKINGKSEDIGGIVGYINNYNSDVNLDQNILNCYADIKINANSGETGGIVGDIWSNNSKVIIKNISVKGSIVVKGGYSSGMIAFLSCKGVSIKNCNSSINIKSESGKASGLVTYGYVYRNGNDTDYIEDCFATGNIVFDNDCTEGRGGGLFEDITFYSLNVNITNCYYIGDIINSNYYSSGIISYFNTDSSNINLNMSNCYSKGNLIIGNNGGNSGGLIGYIDSEIANLSNCYSYMKIESFGSRIGGLIGYGSGINFSNCYYIGNIDNKDNKYNKDYDNSADIGGLIGNGCSNYTSSKILNSYAKVNIYSDSTHVGGLIGDDCNIDIENCHYEGNISGKGYVGGILGHSFNTVINNCYVNGTITGKYDIGGLSGYVDNLNTENSYFKGNIIVKNSDNLKNSSNFVGGLLGELNKSSVKNSYFNGEINIVENEFEDTVVGGLIGSSQESLVENSYFKGKITANDAYCKYDYIGGIAGNFNGTSIKKSYAQADLINNDKSYKVGEIGGLVGNFCTGNIEDSYFKGKITSPGYIGGISGNSNTSNITNSYSAYILGDDYNSNFQKGINGTGKSPNTISTYWDIESSKVLTDLSTAQGKTITEMKNQTNYSDWDFTNIWQIDPNINDGYPYLKDLKDTI